MMDVWNKLVEQLLQYLRTTYNNTFNISSLQTSASYPPYVNEQIQQLLTNLTNRMSNKTYDSVDIPAVRTMIIVAYLIVIIAGVLSNSTVIFVVAMARSSITVTNLFVISLSISDLTLCLFSLPIQLHYQLTENWVFGEVLCRISLSAFAVPMFVSTSCIFIIAFDRHRLVVHPFKKRLTVKLTFLLILADICFSVFFASPVMYFTMYNEISLPYIEFHRIVCNERWPSIELRLAYSIFVFFILFCIPLIMTAVLYFQIYVCLAKKSYNPHKYKKPSKSSNQMSNIAGELSDIRVASAPHSFQGCDNKKSAATAPHRAGERGNFLGNLTPHLKTCETRGSCVSTCSYKSNVPNQSMKRRFNKTNRILIATVINFFICWTPWNIFGLLTEINSDITKGKHFKVLDLMLKWLAMLSVCINPLLYCYLNENLRCEVNAISVKLRSSSRLNSNFISSLASNPRRNKAAKLSKKVRACQEKVPPINLPPQPQIRVNDPSSYELLPAINVSPSSANEV